MRGLRHIAAVALLGALSATAWASDADEGEVATPAPEGGGVLGAAWRRMAAAFDAASASRAPTLAPPVPVAVKWKARRLVSLDLGAPLLALTAGDLDGDGRAEAIAVTERDVIVLAPRGRRALAEVARAALPAEPATTRPRDAVGSVDVVPGTGGEAGAEIWARSSLGARGGRFALDGGVLRELGPVAGFPVCGVITAELARGRNWLEGAAPDAQAAAGRLGVLGWPARFYAARCRSGLVDPVGRQAAAHAALTQDGELTMHVAVRCRRGDAGCRRDTVVTAGAIGVAFAIADVDRDGRVELIASTAVAPGDADAVVVYSAPAAGGAVGKPVFKRGFSGGVAGIAAADLDGDGDVEVIAAVRLAGSQRVDLWLLD